MLDIVQGQGEHTSLQLCFKAVRRRAHLIVGERLFNSFEAATAKAWSLLWTNFKWGTTKRGFSEDLRGLDLEYGQMSSGQCKVFNFLIQFYIQIGASGAMQEQGWYFVFFLYQLGGLATEFWTSCRHAKIDWLMPKHKQLQKSSLDGIKPVWTFLKSSPDSRDVSGIWRQGGLSPQEITLPLSASGEVI